MSSVSVVCSKVDMSNEEEAATAISLLDAYANDLMGGAEPLSEYTRSNLAAELAKRPTCHVFVARADGVPCGLVSTI
jgi:hypothetical protein